MLLIWGGVGEWGGVCVLIMRFAEYLRAHDIEFLIAEPVGTRLRDDLPWAPFVAIEDVPKVAPQIDRVLMCSVAMLRNSQFPWDALGKARLLAWVVQPNSPLTSFVPFAYDALRLLGYSSLAPLRRLFRGHHQLVGDLFKTLIDGGSLVVMDEANRRSLQYFFPQSDASQAATVPIPAPLGPPIAAKLPPTAAFTFGYLGRVDPTKWTALGPFIATHLAAMAAKRPVKLFAVCEGAGVPLLERACRKAGIELELHGFAPNATARRLIRERSHLAVSMGTSALDVAATGHPCLLIDTTARSVRPRAQQRFWFLHEAEGYTLGEFSDFPGYRPGSHTLEEVVAMVENQDIGEASRHYVATHHDPEICFSALYAALSSCRVTVSEIAPLALGIERSIRSKNRYYDWVRRLARARG